MQAGTNFTTHTHQQLTPNATDLRKPMIGVKSRNDKMYSVASANPSATQALIDHAYQTSMSKKKLGGTPGANKKLTLNTSQV